MIINTTRNEDKSIEEYLMVSVKYCSLLLNLNRSISLIVAKNEQKANRIASNSFHCDKVLRLIFNF